ncbi:hypothetical protein VPH35_119493 [Triticum aestivum]
MDDVESQAPHGDQEIEAARHCPCWLIMVVAVLVGALIAAPTGLSFNLTLGVASQSYVSEACIMPGTYMEVTYRGVQIAVSAPERRRICAKPRKAVEQHVLAMATTVPYGTGVAVFDVTLHLPVGSYGRANAWVPGCKGMRVGQGAVTCESPDQ